LRSEGWLRVEGRHQHCEGMRLTCSIPKYYENWPRNLSGKPLQILGLGLKTKKFFLEYGHDGYKKNPLSIQILEKSTFLCDKMHPKQYILKQKWLSLFSGALFLVFHNIFACNFFLVHFVIKVT
jgi:hypothetical protein